MPTGVYKRTEAHKRNIGIANKGKILGRISPMKGKKHSEETKKKMSRSNSGEKNGFYEKHHSEETKRKISEANTGFKRSDETKEKMRKKARRGKRHHNWNPDREYIRKHKIVYPFMVNSINRLLYDKNGKHSEEILGYTKEDLMKHLESKFIENMSWKRHGRGRGAWQIDHIKPVSLFLKEGCKDPKIINALSNLQPLWEEDNLKKKDKYEEEI